MTSRLWKLGPTAGTALLLCLSAASSWTLLKGAILRLNRPNTQSLLIDRFEELKADLPAYGTVGFLSDLPASAADMQDSGRAVIWFLAEYSLAPIVLKPGADTEMVVACFDDPAKSAAIIASSGLEIVRRYDAGLLLLRRKPL